MLRVIALWNFRLLGSTVTTGDTATPRPRSFAVSSESMICACRVNLYHMLKLHKLPKYNVHLRWISCHDFF